MEPVDARAWFAEGKMLGDGFLSYNALEYVDALYAAGATSVTVEDGSILMVGLPADPEARARLFAIYNGEVDKFDQDFGGEETPGHEMTAEEADLLGAEPGEWIVDDLHAVDNGQTALHFWWD